MTDRPPAATIRTEVMVPLRLVDGYATVARDGRDADLVPPGDAVALAKAISQALADRSHADQLIASGAERAASFSMEHLAEIYVEQYTRARTMWPPAERRRRR